MSVKDWRWDPLQIVVIIAIYKVGSALGRLLYLAVMS